MPYLPHRLIRSQMAAGKYTGMVLLDLQKAFDTVDHESSVANCKLWAFILTLLNGLSHTYLTDNKLLA